MPKTRAKTKLNIMKSRLLIAAIIILAAFSASAQPHPQDKGYNFVQNISRGIASCIGLYIVMALVARK